MNKIKFSFVLFFFSILTIYSIKSVIAGENQYVCSVKHLTTSDNNDKEFVSKNLRKNFLITISKEKVFVTQLSNDFKNSQSIYQIIKRGKLGIFSIKKIDNVGFDTFIFHENTGKGTLVFQTFLSVTGWHIECKNK